jgi:hypothetical protein
MDAGGLFLAKILGFAGAVILYHYTTKETYYYFRNAGWRMRQIIALASIIDIVFYILLLLMFNLTTHAIAYFESR